MSKADEVAIIVFAREPSPGKVKTRLAATLPPGCEKPREFAAGVYAACVEALFQTLESLPFPVLLFTPPDSSPEYFKQFGIDHVFTQIGRDLGERMRNAFAEGFSRYNRILLIGSDLPQLRGGTLMAACSALDGHDCVLGPALDGGYYLIGFTKSGFCDCFQGVEWSTDQVLAQTMARLDKRKTALLESYRDIDTHDDLKALASSGACPAGLVTFLRERRYR